MNNNNCPYGYMSCYGCCFATTGGCPEQTNAISITEEGIRDYWQRRHDELMKLPKEELVEMLIGKPNYL